MAKDAECLDFAGFASKIGVSGAEVEKIAFFAVILLINMAVCCQD